MIPAYAKAAQARCARIQNIEVWRIFLRGDRVVASKRITELLRLMLS